MVCAEPDLARPHAALAWRHVDGLPVIEIANHWPARSFEDTYRDPAITARLDDVLALVQPDVLHVHNLLNLSFDLPALAQARGIPTVATLHDYTLVCPSGGQRVHRAEAHLCETIDADRCARCFRESPFAAQAAFGALTRTAAAPARLRLAARSVAKALPRAMRAASALARRAPTLRVAGRDIEARQAAARQVMRTIDLFVAPSRAIAREFEALGVPADRLRVSGYGMAPLAPPPRAARHGRLRLGYVGTITWHKGVHVLLDAARRLPPDQYELVVFGGLDVFPDYAAALQRQGDGLPIAWKGAFDPDRAAEAYAQIDVLVVPSIWLENSPLVIHEALMAGVPVVGARIGGIPELVDHERNGLLYNPSSADALAAALGRLVNDPALVARLVEGVGRGLPAKSLAEDAREWDAIYMRVAARREATA